jgi:hypothetical protein
MRRLIIVAILIAAWPALGTEYYVSQSGTGGGETNASPVSIADFNAGFLGQLDGDTIHFVGSFTTALNTPDGGTSEARVVLDLSAATFTGSTQYQALIDEDYVSVLGGIITVGDTTHTCAGIYVSGIQAVIDGTVIVGQGDSATYLNSRGVALVAGGSEMAVKNCTISHVTIGILLSGTAAKGGFSGTIGGRGNGNVITFCRHNPTENADGIAINAIDSTNHDFTGLTISHNTIGEWGDDGIDLYYGSNVVVEHNIVGPSTWDSDAVEEGNGIKCGGANGGGATGNIIRHNTVKGISHTGANANNYGITTNYGQRLEIYRNVIDSAEYGIVFLGTADSFKAYNNTIINIRKRAAQFQANVTGVSFYANILDGDEYDMITNTGCVIIGGGNVFMNNAGEVGPGSYTDVLNEDQGTTDPDLDNKYGVKNSALAGLTYVPGAVGYVGLGKPGASDSGIPTSTLRIVRPYIPPAE